MPPIAGSLMRAWKAIWVTNMEYDATCAVGTQSDSPIRGAGSNTLQSQQLGKRHEHMSRLLKMCMCIQVQKCMQWIHVKNLQIK